MLCICDLNFVSFSSEVRAVTPIAICHIEQHVLKSCKFMEYISDHIKVYHVEMTGTVVEVVGQVFQQVFR